MNADNRVKVVSTVNIFNFVNVIVSYTVATLKAMS